MSKREGQIDAWDMADSIGKCYALVSIHASEFARKEGLTASKVIALGILGEYPKGLTQTEWGKYQCVSRQRASIVSSELGNEGLINVIASGRSNNVSLTAKGREAVSRYRQSFGGALQAKMCDFSSEQMHQLVGLLEDLATSLSRDMELK